MREWGSGRRSPLRSMTMGMVFAALCLAPVLFAPAEASSEPLSVRVNFQPEASTVPSGYTKDYGVAYDAVRASGWVRPGTSEPVDMTKNTRERTAPSDGRLKTLMVMQGNGAATQPNKGSWEYDLPNGDYEVTVGVGDAAYYDGTDGISVEGEPVIPVFQRSASETHRTGSGTVTVTDGKLTVDATGTNTKLNYIDITTSGTTPPPSSAEVEVENGDGVPFADRLVFSRIQSPENGTKPKPDGTCCIPVNGVHDVATLRVKNTGTEPLAVTGLPIVGPWELADPIALPVTVQPGGRLDVRVKFVAQEIGTQGGLHTGTLTVQSDDANEPSTVVQLSGFWQSISEGGQEPNLVEIARTFGYKTTILKPGQSLNRSGRIQAVGEEVLSPYWRRADESRPVSVRQIGAHHGQGSTATLRYTKKGVKTGTSVLTHLGVDGQTVLPRKAGQDPATGTAPAYAEFVPASNGVPLSVFGLSVDSEHSDPTLNNRQVDYDNNCPQPAPGELETCGHHIRFWPARDRAGALMPDAYLMTMDYSGINYDYQDNVYLVQNIKPEPQALHRLDAAGSSVYRDVSADFWKPDTGLFAPSGAISEGANVSPQEIANTDDDALYRTYRGYTGNVPLAERVLTYKLPTGGLQKMDLRLHFAERFSGNNAPGRRLFDIEAEGKLLRDDFDIFAAAGALNTATTLTFRDVVVSDGELTLAFKAVADHPSVAAIEVLCRGVCPTPPPDTIPPAAPGTIATTSSPNGLALDWGDNAEADLAGYNVSRATSATGTFTKLNKSPLTASGYLDPWVTAGKTYFYKVTAVDKAGNASAASTASATAQGPARAVQWSSKAPQAYGNSEAQGATVNGKLYTFGGFDSLKPCCTPTNRAYVYDPVSNVWSPIANLPHANGGGVTHAGTTTDGRDVYLAGGYISNSTGTGQVFGTRLVFRYNVASNSYTRLPDLPVARSAGRLAYLNGKLHFIGGSNQARTEDVGDHYVLDLANPSAGWSTRAPLPNPRTHAGAVVLGGKIYYVGGQHRHDDPLIPQDDVHVYDPAADRWTEVASLPKPRNHISEATFVLDGKIIVAGGQINHNQSLADVTAYDPASDTWTELTPLPALRHSGVAGAIGGRIFYTTGLQTKNTFMGVPQ